MEIKAYQLRFLPIFEQALITTANYISNVLKNEDAALRLIDDVEAVILERLNNPAAFEPYRSMKREILTVTYDKIHDLKQLVFED